MAEVFFFKYSTKNEILTKRIDDMLVEVVACVSIPYLGGCCDIREF